MKFNYLIFFTIYFLISPNALIAQTQVFDKGVPRNFKLYFEFNEAKLSEENQKTLLEISKIIKANLNQFERIRIEANSDAIEARHHKNIAKKRGKTVYNYLVSLGVPDVLLKVYIYNNERPLDTDKTKVGRAKNRRVEFFPDTVECTQENRKHYEAILTLRKKYFGPKAPELISNLECLVILYSGQGELIKADQAYKMLLSIGNRNDDYYRHKEAKRVTNILVQEYVNRRMWNQVEDLLLKEPSAFQILGSKFRISYLINIAEIFKKNGQVDRASHIYQTAFSLLPEEYNLTKKSYDKNFLLEQLKSIQKMTLYFIEVKDLKKAKSTVKTLKKYSNRYPKRYSSNYQAMQLYLSGKISVQEGKLKAGKKLFLKAKSQINEISNRDEINEELKKEIDQELKKLKSVD